MGFDSIAGLTLAVIKGMVLLGLVMYAIFALVIVRQEQLMDRVIDETFEPVLRILVVVHLAGAIGLLIFAFISL